MSFTSNTSNQPTPEYEQRITELHIFLRYLLLVPSSFCPFCSIAYAVTGNSFWNVMSQALMPLCFSLLIIHGFAAPREKTHPLALDVSILHRPRELRLLITGGGWFFAVNGGTWYGNVYSDPNGNPFVGWFVFSDLFWLVSPIGIVGIYFRRRIALLSSPTLHNYLFTAIFKIGFTSLVPILYLTFGTSQQASSAVSAVSRMLRGGRLCPHRRPSLVRTCVWLCSHRPPPPLFTHVCGLLCAPCSHSPDTIKCLDEIVAGTEIALDRDFAKDCSGIMLPQMSICMFLVVMLVSKIAGPMSNTRFDSVALISLDLPKRVLAQGMFAGTR